MGKKLGLVLAGGGSLGAYEVGALKALNELGLKFDIVTGTSIGAINAFFVATNQIDKLVELWENITIEQVVKNSVNINAKLITKFSFKKAFKALRAFGRIKRANITPFKDLCKKNIDPNLIKEDTAKIGIVATEFPSFKKRKIVLNEIPAELRLQFLHASSACFPIFPIEKIKDKHYVDGGYKDNMPVEYCFELGADEIILIDMGMPKIPRREERLCSLPNVKRIQNKSRFKSIMDFERETLDNNIKQGYLDAYKSFGRYIGKKYYFIKEESIVDKENELVKKIIKKPRLFSLYLKNRKEKCNIIYLFVECLLNRIKANKLVSYKFNEAILLVKANYKMLRKKEKELLKLIEEIYL
jgi:NTE family protein